MRGRNKCTFDKGGGATWELMDLPLSERGQTGKWGGSATQQKNGQRQEEADHRSAPLCHWQRQEKRLGVSSRQGNPNSIIINSYLHYQKQRARSAGEDGVRGAHSQVTLEM